MLYICTCTDGMLSGEHHHQLLLTCCINSIKRKFSVGETQVLNQQPRESCSSSAAAFNSGAAAQNSTTTFVVVVLLISRTVDGCTFRTTIVGSIPTNILLDNSWKFSKLTRKYIGSEYGYVLVLRAVTNPSRLVKTEFDASIAPTSHPNPKRAAVRIFHPDWMCQTYRI